MIKYSYVKRFKLKLFIETNIVQSQNILDIVRYCAYNCLGYQHYHAEKRETMFPQKPIRYVFVAAVACIGVIVMISGVKAAPSAESMLSQSEAEAKAVAWTTLFSGSDCTRVTLRM
ncbi:MAG: hypothetical protein NT033_08345 [Candidatus Omnitrophica bacterium]|nr:hypothetical protein [Candidatus Omnitrophota bacterium]